MANVYIGLFRTIFKQTTSSVFSLIQQFSTGATKNEYSDLKDGVKKPSNNNMGAQNVDYPQYSVLSRGVTWIGSNGDGITAMFSGAGRNPTTPANVSSPSYTLYNKKIAIFAGKSFIALAPDVGSSSTYIKSGGFHTETDNGTKYVVSYILRRLDSPQGVRIEKYRTVYDENIDQSTIVTMPFLKSVDYLDNTILFENNKYDPINGKTLVTNKAGDKTIFFVDKKDSNGNYGNDRDILILTDDSTTFAINYHSTFIKNSYTSTSANSKTVSGSSALNYTGEYDTTNCPESIGVLLTSSSDRSWNGDFQINESIQISYDETFVGVAYSRYDDSIIIATSRINTGSMSNTVESGTQTFTENKTDGVVISDSVREQYTLSNINATTINQTGIYVNGVSTGEFSNLTGTKISDATVNNTFNNTGFSGSGSENTIKETPQVLYVIDLPSLIFAVKVNVYDYTVNFNYAPQSGTKDQTSKSYERVYVIANGVKTKVYESAHQITTTSGSVTYDYLGSWFSGVQSCSGDCDSWVKSCNDPIRNYTITETFDTSAGTQPFNKYVP